MFYDYRGADARKSRIRFALYAEIGKINFVIFAWTAIVSLYGLAFILQIIQAEYRYSTCRSQVASTPDSIFGLADVIRILCSVCNNSGQEHRLSLFILDGEGPFPVLTEDHIWSTSLGLHTSFPRQVHHYYWYRKLRPNSFRCSRETSSYPCAFINCGKM